MRTLKSILWTVKYIAGKVEKFFVYRVLSLNDTPHRIALGVAVGMFVAWTPTIPFQMLLTVAISWMLGANKFVGVPFVWLSNPATLVPVFVPNYVIGCWVMGREPNAWTKIGEAITFHGGWIDRLVCWYTVTSKIFWELWVGSLIVALFLGVLTYFAVYRMTVVFRQRLHHRLEKAHSAEGNPESQAKS